MDVRQLTDQDLRDWSRRPEDQYIERKTIADQRDWLKTVVAFANSVPIGECGVLYIGLREDGTSTEIGDPDGLQRTLRQRLESAYPKIEYSTRLLKIDAQQCLCVIVPGSPRRPHFAGPAYVRRGSESLAASEQLYEELIAERHSKAYKIRQFRGKPVSVQFVRASDKHVALLGRVASQQLWVIEDCNQFSATFRDQFSQPQLVSLDRIELLATQAPAQLVIEIKN